MTNKVDKPEGADMSMDVGTHEPTPYTPEPGAVICLAGDVPDGRRITAVGKGKDFGPFVEVEGYGTAVFPTIDADGMITVLVERES